MSNPQQASGVFAGKTVEVRRSEAAGDKGRASTPQDLQRLFLLAQEDRHRPRIGLPPLPRPRAPAACPSECAPARALTQQGHGPCISAPLWQPLGFQSIQTKLFLADPVSDDLQRDSHSLTVDHGGLLVAQGQEEGDPVG